MVLSSVAATNPRWLAPEILSGKGYTYASDVYAFGIILWGKYYYFFSFGCLLSMFGICFARGRGGRCGAGGCELRCAGCALVLQGGHGQMVCWSNWRPHLAEHVIDLASVPWP